MRHSVSEPDREIYKTPEYRKTKGLQQLKDPAVVEGRNKDIKGTDTKYKAAEQKVLSKMGKNDL